MPVLEELSTSMKDQLTIVVTTSMVPSNPSTALIDRSIASVLAGCGGRLLILCDGHKGNLAYAAYMASLRSKYPGAVYAAEKWCNQAGTLRRFFDKIETEYLLLWEHDWELLRPLPVADILASLANPVRFLRLNKRPNVVAGWDRKLVPYESRIPLLATPCWSSNPHFARTDTYRNLILPHCLDGGAIEPRIMGKPGFAEKDADAGLESFTRRWGMFVYGKLNEPPVVRHLDGRETRVL